MIRVPNSSKMAMKTSRKHGGMIVILTVLTLAQLISAQRCGRDFGWAMCGGGNCCSQWGYCGNTCDHCDPGKGCQSSCDASKCGGGGGGKTGRASYYTAPYVPSACFGYDQGQFSQYFAAAGDGNPNIWNNGQNCGKFFNIKCTGNGCKNSNTISVKVVDRCPNGCSGGRAFDLSYDTFNAIANPDVGVISIEYSG